MNTVVTVHGIAKGFVMLFVAHVHLSQIHSVDLISLGYHQSHPKCVINSNNVSLYNVTR